MVNCLAYIDLNLIRAGIVKRPEAYRWSSIGYHLQTGNQDDLLSLDLGMKQFVKCSDTERLTFYHELLYETGAMDKRKSARIAEKVEEKEIRKGFTVTGSMWFRYRTRYFTDSGIIGTKAYVFDTYQRFKNLYPAKKIKSSFPSPVSAGSTL